MYFNKPDKSTIKIAFQIFRGTEYYHPNANIFAVDFSIIAYGYLEVPRKIK